MFDDLERVRTENRSLANDLKNRLLINEQLRTKTRCLQRDLEEYFCLFRLKKAMHSAKPMDARIPINFPSQKFTLESLAAENPAVCHDDLMMHLAYRILLHQVTFSPQSQRIAFPPAPLVYQVVPGFGL